MNVVFKKATLLIFVFVALTCKAQQRKVVLLDTWKFSRTDDAKAIESGFNDKSWSTVTVPHDWAVAGPFDEKHDQQIVMVKEDGETRASKRTGRTGSLPHVGIGWYRNTIFIPATDKGKRVFIEFDGAMSFAEVFLNGTKIGEWPYGYSSFMFELTNNILFGGNNTISVRLNNPEESSRWYPGAGLYRNVRLVTTNIARIAHWGTFVTTPKITDDKALVNVKTTLDYKGINAGDIKVITSIVDKDNKVIVSDTANGTTGTYDQNLSVNKPELWSTETPVLYKSVSNLWVAGKLADTYETKFGIRTIDFTADSGFLLNGKRLKIQGVCNHHDLGPLGAAVNYRALKRQLELLKEMGSNAVRTSHNPPDPQLLDLCDELGFLVMDEAFDEWKIPKLKNGYHKLFDKWAEKDLVALIRRDRNHPSVILWSIGNEIPEQRNPNGAKVAQFLTDIAHREDPTRYVTIGSNNIEEAIRNGFAKVIDVFGLNYHWPLYEKLHKLYPDLRIIGSETESTVSSRGVYKFPAIPRSMHKYNDLQVSSYVLDAVRWGNTPDEEFIVQDKNAFIAGCFVWTGFDYLGEPTPYMDDYPSHSSYFGLLDLGGIPKDIYYLFQSNWTSKKMIHLLPHWTWPGKEGDTIPVHCFTNYNKAELFVNGKSYGIQTKNPDKLYGSKRLIWDNVIYEPGEIKVVALDVNNKPALQATQKTAKEAHRLLLEADRKTIQADGKDLSFITVSVKDSKDILCPDASNNIIFSVNGPGKIIGVTNGDATNTQILTGTEMEAFSGKCIVVVQSLKTRGSIKLTAKSAGLKEATISIQTK